VVESTVVFKGKYFEREIVPRLERMGSKARFIESPSLAEKVALLCGARAVLRESAGVRSRRRPADARSGPARSALAAAGAL